MLEGRLATSSLGGSGARAGHIPSDENTRVLNNPGLGRLGVVGWSATLTRGHCAVGERTDSL
jgi:hypothetical protein